MSFYFNNNAAIYKHWQALETGWLENCPSKLYRSKWVSPQIGVERESSQNYHCATIEKSLPGVLTGTVTIHLHQF